AVIPCGGEGGKQPLVRWPRRRLPEAVVERLAPRFAQANVGILTGLSGVTIVDCDSWDVVPEILQRCGDTPVKALTPSGRGPHLWYCGGGARTVPKLAGMAVHVRGVGGLPIIPPSVSPETAKPYTWLRGSLDELSRLPAVRPGSLPTSGLEPSCKPRSRL